ncbi:MAG: hypothetical protein US69_C0002G0015 [candidate division TM6 bacterium GW2011_GWF2_38_10]|nr:MAG: hypothetical protein US69_C0002G0015 [candidate division TM6 bacterium GW2011_GWF2_38_10]
MTQGLWVVNSSLLIVLGLAVFANSFLAQEPPILRLKRIVSEEYRPDRQESAPTTIKTWEKIYLSDIFKTFVKTEKTRIVKKSFITPIPEPRIPTIPPTPEIKTVDFVAPLTISIKGLIVAADEYKSIAMIADETNKEDIYHLGDKIKDAQIIKIAQNRIIFIRSNGQHETFYLRSNQLMPESTKKWDEIIKKVSDQQFEVDPKAFEEEIETLGFFLERFSVIGTVFSEGNPIGIRIGKLDPESIGAQFGLIENDIITTINAQSTTTPENRIALFDAVTAMKEGETITVELLRGNTPIKLLYTLKHIEKTQKALLPPGAQPTAQPQPGSSPDAQLQKSRLQEREHRIREFKKQHAPKQNNEALAEVRNRLLNNLKTRLRNTRVR